MHSSVYQWRLPDLPQPIQVKGAIMLAVGLIERMRKALMPICSVALREGSNSAVVEPPLHGDGHVLDLREGGKPRLCNDGKVLQIAV